MSQVLQLDSFFEIPLKLKWDEAKEQLSSQIIESWEDDVHGHRLQFIQTNEKTGELNAITTYVFDKNRFILGVVFGTDSIDLQSARLRDLIHSNFNGLDAGNHRNLSIEDRNGNIFEINKDSRVKIIHYNARARDSFWVWRVCQYLKIS